MLYDINGTIFMERKIRYDEIFRTKILNKKILLLEPGCDLQNSHWCGLNFHGRTKCTTIRTTSDIEEIKNTHWDYIVTHVFGIRRHQSENLGYKLSDFEEYNVTGDVLILDELGEGFSITDDTRVLLDELKIQDVLNVNRVLWLAPFHDYKHLKTKYPFVEFFAEKFASWFLFCGKQSHIISGGVCEKNGIIEEDKNDENAHHIVAGLKWKPEEKEKLFMCLNNDERAHRTLMVHYLTEEGLLDDGYVSYLGFGGSSKVSMVNKQGEVKLDVKTKRLILPWENGTTIDAGMGNRFGLQTKVCNKTYIDVVTESSTSYWPFKTEKSLKPFYNLQFPIIYGHEGIVNDLRELGFDMFDDIINHDYDNVSEHPQYNPRRNSQVDFRVDAWIDNIRIPILVKELKRLSTLDIKTIYENNKDRFIKNQELIWELMISDNQILYKLGKFIFDDNIEYMDTPESELKKIYQ